MINSIEEFSGLMQTLNDPSSSSGTGVRLAGGWSAVGHTDVGLVRPRNEDHFVISPELGLCAVADGLGGAPAGDIASKLACETLTSALGETARTARAGETLTLAFAATDRAVLERVRKEPSLSGMGTTLSAIWFREATVPDRVCFAHVGDSRIYVLRPAGLEQITEDETAAMEFVRQGQMTLAEAKRSLYWHLLTQSIGGHEPVPQVGDVSLESASAVLLCSDGLTGMVEDAEIEELLRGPSADPASALVEAALRNGGEDNVTVIVLSQTG